MSVSRSEVRALALRPSAARLFQRTAGARATPGCTAPSTSARRVRLPSSLHPGSGADPLSADDKPTVGAVVQLKDMRSLQIRSFITQDDGTYHFSGLRGDIEYQLTAKAGDASAGPKTLSIFDSRKEAILNFKLDKK
jgi:hypothetical protein